MITKEDINKVINRTQYMALRYIEERLEHKTETNIDFNAIKRVIELAEDITILLIEYKVSLEPSGEVAEIKEIKEIKGELK